MRGRGLRPAIPIKLVDTHGNMKPATPALVDSGCDISTFPMDWAQTLGIDVATDCEEGTGDTAGGKTKQYYYPPGVDAIVMGQRIHLEAVFSEKLKIVLLGRNDFFAQYKRISFDQANKTFRIEFKDA